VPVPFTLAHPTWEAAPDFDIRRHVRRHKLRAPGNQRQLAALAGRLFAQPLDREHPLWELHQIDGIDGERSAIFAKVHHCMIDGVSGVQLMEIMFDVSPNPPPPPPAPPMVAPPPLPTPLNQATRALWDGVQGLATQVRGMVEAVRHPQQALAVVGSNLASLQHLARVFSQPVPATPYNGHVSTLRRAAWATLPLHEVKAIKNRLGGTVNDVILTIISAALRGDFERREMDPDGLELRAMCPVNVRRADEHLQLGNRVSMMFAPLPIGIYDPLERLRRVRAIMARVKASGESGHVSRLLDLVDLVPPPVQVPLANLQVGWTPVNTVCTNVPGPPVSLYVQGRRLEVMAPLVPLAQGVGLAFAILSYADAITLSVTSDPALVGDVDALATGILDAHAELCVLAGLERDQERARHSVLPERKRRQQRVLQIGPRAS
jgi:WS/DGAT/MGAT family acyltransferase